ncbi:heat shock protein 23-like [Culicoides brevitarsis]|uniref:heat shock protein 23-like n=1 Tax=Culicoides brevitarsis TaxID=469753 RepID=UPI00307BC190
MSLRSLMSLMMEPPSLRMMDPWRHAMRLWEPEFSYVRRTPYLLNQYLREAEKELETMQQVDDKAVKFTVDVKHFKPEEISVKLEENNVVVVEGKHEEVSDEHGTISRHFVRKFGLPESTVNVEKLQSSLSADGILTITAPKLEAIENKQSRTIPIEHTGPVREAIKEGEK